MIFGRRAVSTVVGLDLGSHSVKIVEMNHSGKSPTLVNYGITELVPDAIQEGKVVDRESVLESINVLFDTCQIANRQVNVALNGTDVIIKTIQTDRMSNEELEKAISWEAEQNVPFPLSEISLDYQVLDPEGDDPRMNVLLVAAKRDLIDEKLALLKEAECEVVLMDVDTFALMNALETNYESIARGCHCIVHFGNESTHLGLVRNGLPILTRNLQVGGKKLVETIQGQLGISEDKAYMALYGSMEELESGESAESEVSAESEGEGEKAPPDITPFLPVLLDEVDGLQGREDKGGIQAIVSLLKEAKQPVILTANDIYSSKKLAGIRGICSKQEFKKPRYTEIARFLAKKLKYRIFFLNAIETDVKQIREIFRIAEFEGQGKTILVVEDSKFMSRRIIETLKNAGHNIIANAKNGIEAVSLYKEFRPDIVTMDVTMKGKDGISAAIDILNIDPGANIIFLTILNDPKIKDKIMNLGARGVVNKKNTQEILDLIERI